MISSCLYHYNHIVQQQRNPDPHDFSHDDDRCCRGTGIQIFEIMPFASDPCDGDRHDDGNEKEDSCSTHKPATQAVSKLQRRQKRRRFNNKTKDGKNIIRSLGSLTISTSTAITDEILLDDGCDDHHQIFDKCSESLDVLRSRCNSFDTATTETTGSMTSSTATKGTTSSSSSNGQIQRKFRESMSLSSVDDNTCAVTTANTGIIDDENSNQYYVSLDEDFPSIEWDNDDDLGGQRLLANTTVIVSFTGTHSRGRRLLRSKSIGCELVLLMS